MVCLRGILPQLNTDGRFINFRSRFLLLRRDLRQLLHAIQLPDRPFSGRFWHGLHDGRHWVAAIANSVTQRSTSWNLPGGGEGPLRPDTCTVGISGHECGTGALGWTLLLSFTAGGPTVTLFISRYSGIFAAGNSVTIVWSVFQNYVAGYSL